MNRKPVFRILRPLLLGPIIALGLPIGCGSARDVAIIRTAGQPEWMRPSGAGAVKNENDTGTAPSVYAADDTLVQGAATLEQLILVAGRRNPSLRAAKDRYAAAVARYGEAVGLPDPVFMWTHRFDPVETRTGPQRDVFTLNQKIPFPGKLDLKGQIAVDEARIAREMYLRETRDVVAELKRSFHELVYLDQAVRIVRQTQDLADHIASKAGTDLGENTDVRRDGVTLFDALKAQSQLSQLSYDLATLLELRVAEQSRINRLLNRPPAAPLKSLAETAMGELKLTRKELFDLALEHRQELKVALLRLQKADKERRLAELSWAPDFFIGGSYLATGSPIADTPDGGKDPWGVAIGFTLPIWGGKNTSRITQAENRWRAAAHDRQDAVNRTLEDLTRLFYRLSNARRLVALYRDSLIPQARSAMSMAEQWQQVGRDNIGRVLEAQSVWLNFNLALARAVADYRETLADLEKTVGMPLGMYTTEVPGRPEHEKEDDR